MSPHVFGIRHHGPGSARSLLRALEELVPDVVLIEGPPEAEEILIHAADPAMKPPVALLIYDPAEPRRCAFYPFAVFSPEWQAIQYGLGRGIPVRFMDLPHTHLMAIERAEEEKSGKDAETGPVHLKKSDGDEEGSEEVGDAENISREQSDESYAALRRDPLRWLAKCAGYEDSERWWEHLIEERRGGEGIFA
ncbi:hypothetical protein HYR69_01285, partial [Candidatus Sumerlaeota bacterium]|nr:hypothetical protein [Candidatus Sumerlaeota bacterium]